MSENKQFEATPKKREDAATKGDLLKLPEFLSITHLSTCYVLLFLLPIGLASIFDLFANILEYVHHNSGEMRASVHFGVPGVIVFDSFISAVGIFAGVCISLFVVTDGLLRRFQYRIVFPRIREEFFSNNMKQLFGERDGMKPVSGLLIIGYEMILLGLMMLFLIGFGMYHYSYGILELEVTGFSVKLYWLSELLFRSILCVSSVWIIFVSYRRYLTRERKLRMSHEELKREIREDAGDPQMVAERKAIHQEILVNDAIEHIQNSTVVVTGEAR